MPDPIGCRCRTQFQSHASVPGTVRLEKVNDLYIYQQTCREADGHPP